MVCVVDRAIAPQPKRRAPPKYPPNPCLFCSRIASVSSMRRPVKRYILTGTPGSGKTTIISALAARGNSVVREAATDVIAEEAKRGVLEPWLDPGFIDRIIALQAEQQMASAGDVQFHDRSPVCTYALNLYLGFSPSAALLEEMARIERGHVFEKRVFLSKTSASSSRPRRGRSALRNRCHSKICTGKRIRHLALSLSAFPRCPCQSGSN